MITVTNDGKEIEFRNMEEIGAGLGLSIDTVRSYIRAGRLKAVKIGRKYYVSEAMLAEFIEGSSPVFRNAGHKRRST